MEEKELQSGTLHKKLRPPEHSDVSIVLNGVGNGAMVGAVLFVLHDLMYPKSAAEKATQKIMGFNKSAAVIFATVAFSAVGGLFGWKEAQRLREYRETLNDEFNKMKADVAANSTAVKQWADKEAARKDAAPETTAAGR